MGHRGWIDVDGGRLYYEVDGDGPAVMLIHGGVFLDLRMWEPQIVAISEQYTVVRFDLRGYGRSSSPDTRPYRHCDDARAVLRALDIERACIVGQSLGGTVAIDIAFAYPDVIEALILAPALPVKGWHWVEEFPLKPALQLARNEGWNTAKAAILDLPLFASEMSIPDVATQLRQMVADYSGWHFCNDDPATFEAPDAIERLSHIVAPALVMVGNRDVLDSRLTADALAAGLANAELHVIEHVGHTPNLEDPDRFNRTTLAFLDRVHA